MKEVKLSNEKIDFIIDYIESLDLSKCSIKEIFNFESIKKELQKDYIDFDVLSIHGCPSYFFNDIPCLINRDSEELCCNCWKLALCEKENEINLPGNQDDSILSMANIQKEDGHEILKEQDFCDDIILYEELQEYKSIGLSPLQLKAVLNLLGWEQVRDYETLMMSLE